MLPIFFQSSCIDSKLSTKISNAICKYIQGKFFLGKYVQDVSFFKVNHSFMAQFGTSMQGNIRLALAIIGK